jgi:opacity protein-like surface antigen
MNPVDIAGGWRFRLARVLPYAGGGVTTILYKETGGFAQPSDDVREWHTGWLGIAGADVEIARWWLVGAELRYRSVNGLGSGGLSEVFGEEDLGGPMLTAKFSFGW